MKQKFDTAIDGYAELNKHTQDGVLIPENITHAIGHSKNQQQIDASERQRKSRQQLKKLGGRSLDLQLEPQNEKYLKKLSIIKRIPYSQLIGDMIHEAAIKIRYPLDAWMNRIRLPSFLTANDILEMPEGATLFLSSFRLITSDPALVNNTLNEFTCLLHKKESSWLIYVKWIYDGGGKLERFPNRVDRFGLYSSFLIEEGYVIFNETKKETEHQISIFCRYAAQVNKQINQSIEHKGYRWINASSIPFILMPDY